jgi:hypothetical protein
VRSQQDSAVLRQAVSASSPEEQELKCKEAAAYLEAGERKKAKACFAELAFAATGEWPLFEDLVVDEVQGVCGKEKRAGRVQSQTKVPAKPIRQCPFC